MYANLSLKTSTAGRNMAGARALWRATGMTDADFQNPSSPLPIPLPNLFRGMCILKTWGNWSLVRLKRQAGWQRV